MRTFIGCRYEDAASTKSVRAVAITSPGSEYPSSGSLVPASQTTGGHPATDDEQFAGTYLASGGMITSVIITAIGSGYTSAPTLVAAGGGGTPATFSASVDPAEIEFRNPAGTGTRGSGNCLTGGFALSQRDPVEVNGAEENQWITAALAHLGTGCDVECGSINCGSISSGDVECGSISSGDIECGAVVCGTVDATSLATLGIVAGGEIRATDDIGGVSGQNTLTAVADLSSNQTGVGRVLLKGATSRDTYGFVKIYIGTTPYYVPVFHDITG